MIALTGENLKNSLGDWIPFANEDAQYFPPAPIGFKFRNAIEGDLVRGLWKEYLSDEALDPPQDIGLNVP